MALLFFLLLLLSGLTLFFYVNNHSFRVPDDELPPVLTIPSLGQIQGSYQSSASGRRFYSFRGIPYAEPPTGALRFKEPIPADPWHEQVLNATKEGPACIQQGDHNGGSVGVEDCLQLNVYTHIVYPELNTTASENSLKPVMVFIHGGSFSLGSGNGETDFFGPGPGYIMDRDVVFVTINYRLGVLGFLSLGDSEAPGNYGLFDQSLALRWIRNHIQFFGGNPKSVTLFGHSAGGASVEYHILSPHSKGLFDRAIAQSGSALCYWAQSRQNSVEKYSKLLVRELNCSSSSSQETMECLRGKDPNEFITFLNNKTQVLGHFPMVPFSPRVDVEREFPFLPANPKKLLKKKRFNSVPFITGLTKNEGTMVTALLVSNGGKPLEAFKQDPVHYIPYMLGLELREDKRDIAQKIIAQYFDAKKTFEEQITEFEQLISDFSMNKGVDESAHLFSQYGDQPTYYYQFAHRGPYSLDDMAEIPSNFDQGVVHAAELFVMFTNSFLGWISKPEDLKVSKMMLDMWTSFAIKGVPQSEEIPDKWLPLDQKSKTRYLKIDADKPGMIYQPMPFNSRLDFWARLFGDKEDM